MGPVRSGGEGAQINPGCPVPVFILSFRAFGGEGRACLYSNFHGIAFLFSLGDGGVALGWASYSV